MEHGASARCLVSFRKERKKIVLKISCRPVNDSCVSHYRIPLDSIFFFISSLFAYRHKFYIYCSTMSGRWCGRKDEKAQAENRKGKSLGCETFCGLQASACCGEWGVSQFSRLRHRTLLSFSFSLCVDCARRCATERLIKTSVDVGWRSGSEWGREFISSIEIFWIRLGRLVQRKESSSFSFFFDSFTTVGLTWYKFQLSSFSRQSLLCVCPWQQPNITGEYHSDIN